MLRKIRITLAWVLFILAILLVLDFSGALHLWLGWVAKVQLVPAVLAGSALSLIFVGLLTLLFGRLYCSVLCPLGIMQDGISYLSGRRKGKKARFRYSKELKSLRWILLVIVVAAIIFSSIGNHPILTVSLLDPWANFGRIAQNIFAPLWRGGNNLLAWVAERMDSYAFHSVDVYIKSGIAFGVALVWLVGIAVLAWWKGRVYCNSICPVGTFLGLLSRFPLMRISIDESKCTKCGVCEKKCKSECINSKKGTIDRSRCVVCFDCLDACNFGAVKFRIGSPVVVGIGTADEKETKELEDGVKELEKELSGLENTIETAMKKKRGMNRRNFFSIAALAAAASPAAVKAQQVDRILLQVDGGLTDLIDKKRPVRKSPIVPPGAQSARNMQKHCVACQLCVAACPNNVLVPSSKLETLMQPEMTYERGYCRPECVECSEVCPAGAILKITPAEKSAISVGNAFWIEGNCVVNRDNVPCTECERHCPTKAITLVPRDPADPRSLKVPAIDNTLCIGCGTCENLCPSNPYSAIYVEGNVTHHTV
ncbi:MAG: 4Fe-4S dicluster domain-containing protein [Alistipes sp.]|jgi:polyferredoxin|nr:4Fe-4S dicluster domain-containing protein [Alistipes sp.]